MATKKRFGFERMIIHQSIPAVPLSFFHPMFANKGGDIELFSSSLSLAVLNFGTAKYCYIQRCRYLFYSTFALSCVVEASFKPTENNVSMYHTTC
jgi:hypothetical protein